MLLTVNESKIQSEKRIIPVFRPLHLIKADLTNWKEKIDSLPSHPGPKAMVELQLTLPQPEIGLSDKVREHLDKKGMELLSFIPIYSKSETIRKKRDNLFELSPLDLFSEFYATKFPDSPDVPEEVRNDFKELLVKVQNAPQET